MKVSANTITRGEVREVREAAEMASDTATVALCDSLDSLGGVDLMAALSTLADEYNRRAATVGHYDADDAYDDEMAAMADAWSES